jgi:hypothetical protein
MDRAVTHPLASAAFAALALFAAQPAHAVAFTGSFMNDTPPPSVSPSCGVGQVLVSFSPGTAITSGVSNFGGFGPSQSHCIAPPPPGVASSYAGGWFSFAFDLGDTLFGTTAGELTPIDGMPGFFDSVVHYTVTGGTGRFLSASGTIEGVGVLNRTLPRPINNLTLTGDLDLPAVPEPSSWALMILGFGAAGSLVRRRRARLVAAAG